MSLLKNLFGKKESSCCDIHIEEIKETNEGCCGENKSEEKADAATVK